MPSRRAQKRRPVIPTAVVLILLVAGIYFTARGPLVPSKVSVGNFQIDTSSVGLAILFLDIILLISLVIIGLKFVREPLIMYNPWRSCSAVSRYSWMGYVGEK